MQSVFFDLLGGFGAFHSSPDFFGYISCVNLKKYFELDLVNLKFTRRKLMCSGKKNGFLFFLARHVGFFYTSKCEIRDKNHLFSFSLTGIRAFGTL